MEYFISLKKMSHWWKYSDTSYKARRQLEKISTEFNTSELIFRLLLKITVDWIHLQKCIAPFSHFLRAFPCALPNPIPSGIGYHRYKCYIVWIIKSPPSFPWLLQFHPLFFFYQIFKINMFLVISYK